MPKGSKGWEQAQNKCSGRLTENASRGSRVSECHMPSTSSLGLALFRSTRSVSLTFSQNPSCSYLSEQSPHPKFLMIATIHRLIFCTLRLCKTRWRMPVRPDTHHFGCHGRTKTQGHCDFADCDPFVPVNAFDNDSTDNLPLFLELPSRSLAPPSTFQYYFPCKKIVASVLLHPGSPSDQLHGCSLKISALRICGSSRRGTSSG